MAEYWGRGFDDTTLKIIVEQVSSDVVRNTSNVRVRIYCKNHIREDWLAMNVDTKYRYNYPDLRAEIRVDSDSIVYDTTRIGSAPYEISKWFMDNNPTGLLYDKTLTIQHDSDGQKSIPISVKFLNVEIPQIRNLSSFAITHRMAPIERKAAFTISGNTMGSAVTITINQQTNTLTHRLYWSFGTQSGTISTNATTSATWTPNITQLAPQIPNLSSGKARIRIETYYGSSKIGEQNLEHVLNLPKNIKPTLSGISLFDGNQKAGVLNLGANTFVQHQSNIKPRFDGANGINGSTIVSYRAELQRFVNNNWEATNLSTSLNNGLMGNANFSGRARVVGYVTDSRGRRSDQRIVELTYLPYRIPALSFKGERVGSGNDRINVVRNVRIAPLTVNNMQKNTGRLTFDVVDTQTNQRTNNIGGSADWVGTTEHEKLNWAAALNGTYDVGKTYLVIGHLSDAFTSVSFEFRVGVEAVPVSISKFGLAVGKEWSRGVLDVGGGVNLPAYFDCDIYVRDKQIQMHQLTGKDGQNINTGTHVDSLVQNGCYYLLNAPGRPNDRNGYLIVQRYNTDNLYIHQLYVDVLDGRMFTRVKVNNVWQPWKQIATMDIVGQKHKLSEDNGVAVQVTGDWNNVTSTGFYRGSGLANQPGKAGAHSWYYVKVSKHDGSWILQEAIDFNGVGSWFRVKMNGVWQPWKEYIRFEAQANWIATGTSGVAYKVTGNIVSVRVDIASAASTDFPIGRIPTTYLPIPNKMSILQLANAKLVVTTTGELRVRDVMRGDSISTQVTWQI
ncbi:TPA: DUF859 family phage minor structural protein [Streptococcus suis]